jgi:hypothetical protein
MGSTVYRPLGLSSSRRTLGALLVLICLALLLVPRQAGAQVPTGDVGDAPDNTNHAGVGMTAYAGVPALFPTVFDAAAGAIQGPYHQSPKANGWLGADASLEADADVLPDADGFRNINPATNSPNRDGLDDGVVGNVGLPQCGKTQIAYQLSGAAAVPAPQGFVNVWIDFNRDGDWRDQFTCTTTNGTVKTVREWAVQNQPVNIVPGAAAWTTPSFLSKHRKGSLWMRISVANIQAPINPANGRADGRGPGAGYVYGETEDYILVPLGNGIYEPRGNNVDGD